MAFFGLDGEPVMTSKGYHLWEKDYDPWGKWTRMAFRDTDGEPTPNLLGMASVRRRFGMVAGRRRVVWQVQEDVDGRRVGFERSCPENETVETGPNEAVIRCLSESGQPLDGGANGAYEVHDVYDDLGRVLRSSFVRADGTTEPYDFGREWHPNGQVRKYMVFDREGQAGDAPDHGSAWMTVEFDALGNEIQRTKYTAEGTPTTGSRDSWARRDRSYDRYGRLIEERLLEPDLETLIDGDAAVTRYEYPHDVVRITRKVRGNGDTTIVPVVEHLPGTTSTFGPDGEPFEVDGIAKRVKRYNELSLVTFEATYDAEGKLAAGRIPAAIIHTTWDAQGRKIRRRYLDPDEQPLVGPEGCSDEIWSSGPDGGRVVRCAEEG